LRVGAFVAVLDVSSNHRHEAGQVTTAPPTATAPAPAPAVPIAISQQQQTLLTASQVRAQMLQNAVAYSSRRAYCQQELTALNAVPEVVDCSPQDMQQKLLFAAMVLVECESAPVLWDCVPLSFYNEALLFIRFPWFAPLYGLVRFVMHRVALHVPLDGSTAEEALPLITQLLHVGDALDLQPFASVTDVPEAATTLSAISLSFAERLVHVDQRRQAVQALLPPAPTTTKRARRRSTATDPASTVDTRVASTQPAVQSTLTSTARRARRASDPMPATSVVDTPYKPPSQPRRTQPSRSAVTSLNLMMEISDRYAACKPFFDVDWAFVVLFLRSVVAAIGNNARPSWTTGATVRMSAFNDSFRRSARDSTDGLDALAMAIGCRADAQLDTQRLLRLLAVLELCDHRQHYFELLGAKFLCKAVECLLADQWRAPIESNDDLAVLLLVFANMLRRPIALMTDKRVSVTLPLRHAAAAAEQGEPCVYIGRLRDDRFCMLQRVADEHAQPSRPTTALSQRCAELIAEQQHNAPAPRQTSFRFKPASETERRLFDMLSSAADVEEVVLSDASLNKAATVHLRDLRRLVVVGEWLNDETINALVAMFVKSATVASDNDDDDDDDDLCDAFSSFTTDKLKLLSQDAAAAVAADKAKSLSLSEAVAAAEARFVATYQSFCGHSFEYLITQQMVSTCHL